MMKTRTMKTMMMDAALKQMVVAVAVVGLVILVLLRYREVWDKDKVTNDQHGLPRATAV